MNAIELTRRLVQFDTRNPPGSENVCALFLANHLKKAGFEVEAYDFAKGRTNLIAWGPGPSDRLPLCLSGHLDTVPLGEASWTRDPLAGTIEGDRLYGRGASDMKSGAAAMVTAACALGPRPDVCLVLTAGEENGCEGARFLAESGLLPERLGALVVGEPTANVPLVGHKGVLWLEIEFAGRTAHGSAPELGDNAVYKAARMIRRLERWTFVEMPHPVLGPPTLNVGMLHGGLNINSVPDRAVISLDIRTIPGVNHDALREAVAGLSDAPIHMRTLADMASVASDPADEWIQQVFAVVTENNGTEPVPQGAAYFTDAAALRTAGNAPPTVILGPGEPSQAHQTDEYVRLPCIEAAVAIYTDIIRSWCGARF